MYEYKIKYVVVVVNEDGELIEAVTEDYLDTYEEAAEFIADMLAEEDLPPSEPL